MTRQFFDLTTLPDGTNPRSVDVATVEKYSRKAVSVTFDDRTANGLPDVDFVDMPTFLELPIDFADGEISVDILSELRADAPDYSRAFAGVAYRITDQTFEAIYIRPLNGIRLQAEPPRSKRAIQYFSYPDWRFERLRADFPDGRYEAGADILPGKWVNLTLKVASNQVVALIDGRETLLITQPKTTARSGRIGLFVDIGTIAYFSNLSIQV